MRYTLTIMAGNTADTLAPVLACADAGVVALATRAIVDRLGLEVPSPLADLNVPPIVTQPEPTWKEKLWTVPADTRLSVQELAEAVGRPRSWVYRHTSPSSTLAPIPHRRLDGLLVFRAGEVRRWLKTHETIGFEGESE